MKKEDCKCRKKGRTLSVQTTETERKLDKELSAEIEEIEKI